MNSEPLPHALGRKEVRGLRSLDSESVDLGLDQLRALARGGQQERGRGIKKKIGFSTQ